MTCISGLEVIPGLFITAVAASAADDKRELPTTIKGVSSCEDEVDDNLLDLDL